MNSCLYEGWVEHRRLSPIVHAFRYRIFLSYLDLSELAEVFRGRWFWSVGRRAIARFERTDHFGDPQQPLDEAIRDWIAKQGASRPTGPIRLLTHLRYCGYVMNPVSFFYCFSADGKSLEHIVAAVTNTPWHERHLYLLSPEQFDCQNEAGPQPLNKQFHVSPFLPMDMNYQWKVAAPGGRLAIEINTIREAKTIVAVSLQLARREISTRSLAVALLRFPLMTQQVIIGIYWQALRLWWKGAPFYTHP